MHGLSFGMIVLCIWLIVSGALDALQLGNVTVRIILGVVACIAGILLLLGR